MKKVSLSHEKSFNILLKGVMSVFNAIKNIFNKVLNKEDLLDKEKDNTTLTSSNESVEKNKKAINDWLQFQVDKSNSEAYVNRALYLKRCLADESSLKHLIKNRTESYTLKGIDVDSVDFICHFVDAMTDKFILEGKNKLGTTIKPPEHSEILMTQTMFRTFITNKDILDTVKRLTYTKSLDVIMIFRLSKHATSGIYEIWYTLTVKALIDRETDKTRFIALF